jgi:hypothetical protein
MNAKLDAFRRLKECVLSHFLTASGKQAGEFVEKEQLA